MEAINLAINNNIFAVLAVLALAVLISLALLAKTRGQLAKLQQKYDFFTKSGAQDIDALLTDTLTKLQQTQSDLAALQQRHDKLRQQVRGCLQVVKLERYDAFDAMGGEMSYSILLADEEKNGVILTSIYGREDSRCYAKQLKDGKPSHPLAEEEKKLL